MGSMPAERALSKTAIWVAAARAIGACEPDEAARNPDSLAELLLGDPDELQLDHPVIPGMKSSYEIVMQDIEVASTVRAMIERTRFIDAVLERAVANGATQILVLGAGLDSRACRYREMLRHTRVFELDRPVTSAFKRRRVDDLPGGAPENLVYVPADLEREAPAVALARHGYDLSRRTFVIMEGVTMYVQEEPLRATFRFLAGHVPGSRIVFDFATRAVTDGLQRMDVQTIPEAARPAVERFLNLIRDEPWVFGMPLDGEEDFLAGVGLKLGELLLVDSEESVARYLTRRDGTTVGGEAHERARAMRRAGEQQVLAQFDPQQRAQAEAVMREQVRQNSYRIAEAAVVAR